MKNWISIRAIFNFCGKPLAYQLVTEKSDVAFDQPLRGQYSITWQKSEKKIASFDSKPPWLTTCTRRVPIFHFDTKSKNISFCSNFARIIFLI